MRLLDAAETIMLNEGYASISSRRVSGAIGVTPAVVHYYFPTTDDLFAALYKRASERYLAQLLGAINGKDPLREIWEINLNSIPSSLATEFMALANHRKSMRAELANGLKYARLMQTQALADVMANVKANSGFDQMPCSPLGIAVLITAAGRSLALEANVGISFGHQEAKAVVEWLLAKLCPQFGAPSGDVPTEERVR
jgi:AcrR family transcriptional regulator